MSNQHVISVLRERRARAEADIAAYRAKVSLARAELDALEATIDLLAADAPDSSRSCGQRPDGDKAAPGAPT